MKKNGIVILFALLISSCKNRSYYCLNDLNIKEINLQSVEYVLQEGKKVGGICYNITLGEYYFIDHDKVEIRMTFPEEQNNKFGTIGDTIKLPSKLLKSDTVQIYTNFIEISDMGLIKKLIDNTKKVNVELIINGELVDSDVIAISDIHS